MYFWKLSYTQRVYDGEDFRDVKQPDIFFKNFEEAMSYVAFEREDKEIREIHITECNFAIFRKEYTLNLKVKAKENNND